jgi:hypothetical protein
MSHRLAEVFSKHLKDRYPKHIKNSLTLNKKINSLNMKWISNQNRYCHQKTDEGAPILSSFLVKSQVLEIHRHEKHFKVSHNKESHKVKVLAMIYFSITG